jgi:Tfp pilus assembly protein PilO
LKKGRTTWWYLGIAVIVAGAALLAMVQSSLQTQKDTLVTELDEATAALSELDTDSLQTELQAAETLLAKTGKDLKLSENKYNRLIESLDAVAKLFDIAAESGVTVFSDGIRLDSFRSTGTSDAVQDGISIVALPVTVSIEGETADILDFTRRVTDEYPFATLVSVNIDIPSVPEKTEGAEPEVETEPELSTAEIRLIIYTYQGEPQ